MTRLLAYAIAGACIGAFAGLLISAAFNAIGLNDIIAASILGFLTGLTAATLVNRAGVLDGPFTTQSQIEGLSRWAEWKLRQGMVPASLRDRIISWLRSKLE